MLIPVDGLFLVVSRKDNSNLWGLPGGKVDPGETLLHAVIRETKEETLLDVPPTELKPIFRCVCKGDVDYDTTTFLFTGEFHHGIARASEPGMFLGLCTEDELCDPQWSPFWEYNRFVFAHYAGR